jgi:hypothetical protein
MPIIKTPVGTFRAQTSGIALNKWDSETERSETLVLQYAPLNGSFAYLPTLSGEGKSTRLSWDKRAAIYFSKEVDMNYWRSSTYMAEINGVVYSQYMRWVEDFILSRGFFIPHAICKDTNPDDCFLQSANGDTFSEKTFDRLASLAVRMRPLTKLEMTGVVLHSRSSPIDVYCDGSTAGASPIGRGIVDYYTELMACLKADDGQDYATALNICTAASSGGVVFTHVQRRHYATYTAGIPFSENIERAAIIPQPKDLPAPGTSTSDAVIAGFILGLIILGVIACMQKLHMWSILNDRCCGGSRRMRVSGKAPLEGGYSQSSELPTYVEWSWLSPSARTKVRYVCPPVHASVVNTPSLNPDPNPNPTLTLTRFLTLPTKRASVAAVVAEEEVVVMAVQIA